MRYLKDLPMGLLVAGIFMLVVALAPQTVLQLCLPGALLARIFAGIVAVWCAYCARTHWHEHRYKNWVSQSFAICL